MKPEEPSRPEEFQQVSPDDYHDYEEQFQDHRGGKSGGGKGGLSKGKKTRQKLKNEQTRLSREKHRQTALNTLRTVLAGFPEFGNPALKKKFLEKYTAWLTVNLASPAPIPPGELSLSLSKSGGPGGQNVNKRETRVILIHLPTQIRVENQQTRSQLENRRRAEAHLEDLVRGHIEAWKLILEPGQPITAELVESLLGEN